MLRVCFVDRCLSFCPFGHCVVCPSIYGFRLPLWNLQTLRIGQYSVSFDFRGHDSVTMVKLYDISSEKFTYIVYIFIAIFGSTFYPCICQLIRFDQYFQGSTGLPEGYVIKLFHLIGVSTLFEGAFSHFRLC